MLQNTGKTSHQKFDFIIAGGGASGLWLAIEMLQNKLLESRSLCIVEQDPEKQNDRTWCFWTQLPLPAFLKPLVSQSWITSVAEGRYQKLAPFTYHHLRSEDFYAACKALLHPHPAISFRYAEVLDIQNTLAGAIVTTPVEKLEATYVFSSIPKFHFPSPSKLQLWQSFFGWRIRFLEVPPQPISLQLMDFNIPQNGATQFVYTLPFDDNRALVELTRFSSENLDTATARAILTAYLSKFETPYEIEEVEINRIPMSNALNARQPYYSQSSGLIPIGAAGGALKPTSGYAFLTMHQHAAQMVQALIKNQPLPTIFRQPRFRFYDALLLQILTQTPHKGSAIFQRLFARVPSSQILKFLSEKTSIQEEIKIFLQLPISLFLKQVVQYITKK